MASAYRFPTAYEPPMPLSSINKTILPLTILLSQTPIGLHSTQQAEWLLKKAADKKIVPAKYLLVQLQVRHCELTY